MMRYLEPRRAPFRLVLLRHVGAALLPSAGRARSRCVNLSSAGAWCAPSSSYPGDRRSHRFSRLERARSRRVSGRPRRPPGRPAAPKRTIWPGGRGNQDHHVMQMSGCGNRPSTPPHEDSAGSRPITAGDPPGRAGAPGRAVPPRGAGPYEVARPRAALPSTPAVSRAGSPSRRALRRGAR